MSQSVVVIDTVAGTVTATVKIGKSPDGIAIDPPTHTAYTANAGDGTASVISTT